MRARSGPQLERLERIDRVVAHLAERGGLSPQEHVVVRLLAHGRRGWEICKELDISRSTYRTHCIRIYAKTGTDDADHLRTLVHTRVIDGLITERTNGPPK